MTYQSLIDILFMFSIVTMTLLLIVLELRKNHNLEKLKEDYVPDRIYGGDKRWEMSYYNIAYI